MVNISKYGIIFLLLLGAVQIAQAQSVNGYEFTYDAAGNRIKREYKTVMIKEGADEEVKHTMAQFEISVFPNPATSYVDVKLSNLGSAGRASIRVIDIAGREIYSNAEAGEQTRIELQDQPNGVYLMEVTIDGRTSDWKIIKEE